MNKLTVRKIIVGLRRRGIERREIANRLGISESAVAIYLRPTARSVANERA